MRRAVVDLTSLRPIWSIPSERVSVIREAFGTGWEVEHVTSPTSSDGDGSGGSLEAVRAAAGVEVYFGWGISGDVISAAGNTLGWVHTAAAGVGGSLTPELRSSGAIITNSRAIHATPIAEWVLAAISFCARGFLTAVAAQGDHRWAKAELASLDTPIRELSDLRVGIIGFGGIGQAVARRCHVNGMQVRAVRRNPARNCGESVQWVGGPDDLLELASLSDVLVIAAPYTSETRRLVDASVLGSMPAGSYLLNVARGALLDEEALLVHLNSGQLAGCVLDVCDTEPLPADHPFWAHPKVFVTPHVSGVSHHFWDREVGLITDNVKRYLQGTRLKNVVNLVAGY